MSKSKRNNKQKTKSAIRKNKDAQIEYDYHLPVLLEESLNGLLANQELGGNLQKYYYIDGTLGGGGHSSEILRRLKFGGILLAFDKDPDAIMRASLKFADYINNQGTLKLYNQCFSQAHSIESTTGRILGILLDLGVSSHQLDTNNRGISYRIDAPLDMRFGNEGHTAKDILHSSSEEELEYLLRFYGEEPFSRVIARRLHEKRRADSLNSVFDLRDAVAQSVPEHLLFRTLSRVFQAIRISVNKELDVLKDTLVNIMPNLAIGGRIVVISYHSLEDRITKSVFKEYSTKESNPKLKIITKKPIEASPQEIDGNFRSRSAKLRIAERIA